MDFKNLYDYSNNGYSRRKILKAGSFGCLTGIGINITNLARGTQEDVEIIIAKTGPNSRSTRLVSQEWYNHTLEARSGRDDLSEQIGGQEGIQSIGIKRGNSSIGNLLTHIIEVNVDNSGTPVDIPSQINGIPVDVNYKSRELLQAQIVMIATMLP